MSSLRQSLELLLQGDRELYLQLCEAGFLPSEDSALAREHLETARVARTLVHELEVNWAGVEVVLHMRSQLVATRRQLSELADIVRRAQEEQQQYPQIPQRLREPAGFPYRPPRVVDREHPRRETAPRQRRLRRVFDDSRADHDGPCREREDPEGHEQSP